MPIKKNIKLKKECFYCYTFDKSLNPWHSYKCAVSWSCPGINWSEAKKQLAIKSHKKTKGK